MSFHIRPCLMLYMLVSVTPYSRASAAPVSPASSRALITETS